MATAGQRRAPAPSVAADSTAQAAMPTRWPASAPMLSPSERTSDLSSGSSSSPPARLAARVITGPPSGRNATSVPLNADRSYAASARTAARDAAGSLPDCTSRVRALALASTAANPPPTATPIRSATRNPRASNEPPSPPPWSPPRPSPPPVRTASPPGPPDPPPGRAGRSAEPGAWGGDTGGGGGGLGEVIGGGAVRGGCLLGRLSGHLGDAGGGHHPWIDGGQRQRERTIGSGGIQHQPGRGRQGAGAVPERLRGGQPGGELGQASGRLAQRAGGVPDLGSEQLAPRAVRLAGLPMPDVRPREAAAKAAEPVADPLQLGRRRHQGPARRRKPVRITVRPHRRLPVPRAHRSTRRRWVVAGAVSREAGRLPGRHARSHRPPPPRRRPTRRPPPSAARPRRTSASTAWRRPPGPHRRRGRRPRPPGSPRAGPVPRAGVRRL